MDYTKRSDSSAPLRTHLKSNLASLPEISNTVPFNSYIRYCHNLYSSAQSAYNQGDFRRAYVDLYKFQILALNKIPTHKDYRSKVPILIPTKTWLENTKLPALKLLEIVVYYLDFEEDQRVKHSEEFDLIDEFDCDDAPMSVPAPASAPPLNSTSEPGQVLLDAETTPRIPTVEISSSPNIMADTSATAATSGTVTAAPEKVLSRDFSKLSILQLPTVAAADALPLLPQSQQQQQYVVPDFSFPDELEDTSGPTANSVTSNEDRAIIRCIGDYTRFVVPNPSQTTVDVQIGSKHNFFYQDDFHTSYSSFFTKLSPELQVAKSAMEMNRCFFIHLGIAINMHPFALQCAFRRLATIAMENAEDWEKDILAPVCQYCALVDANMLCLLWPRELNAYRICFVSGPLTRPLLSCFEPPESVLLSSSSSSAAGKAGGGGKGSPDSLIEVIIRCSGDHFTLLRPMQLQQQEQAAGIGGFKVISKLLNDAREANLVTQVSPAREPKPTEEERSLREALLRI